jgi:outer membrane protein TolC
MLAACVTVDPAHSVRQLDQRVPGFGTESLQFLREVLRPEERRDAVKALLSKPLGQTEAVRVAMLNSAALQALVARQWAEVAAAAQSGRIGNPGFFYERMRSEDHLEISRMLSFGVLELLTLAQRQRLAAEARRAAQLQLAAAVVDEVTQIRQAWVNAVASAQSAAYAERILQSAQASAELAKRMEVAGNFNRIARARQQAYEAEAVTSHALARQAASVAREQLIRKLGLDAVQAEAMQLPQRLPDLPAAAFEASRVGEVASASRLDVQLAEAQLRSAMRVEGLGEWTSRTDIELGVRREAEGGARGLEVELRLPVFDWGGLQREGYRARSLAAAQHLEATSREAGSQMRESYQRYLTAYELARHHREELLPLRSVISEEALLRYNGMLIGVFELLADARDQIDTVRAVISAEQKFWLAEAALQSAIVGRPTSGSPDPLMRAPAAAAASH